MALLFEWRAGPLVRSLPPDRLCSLLKVLVGGAQSDQHLGGSLEERLRSRLVYLRHVPAHVDDELFLYAQA